MLKLRILLLRNSLYYIILFIALLYFLITYLVPKQNNIYEKELDCKITSIIINDYGLKLELKAKHKLVAYYYIDEVEEFLSTYKLGDLIHISFINKRITNNTIENTFNYKQYLNSKNIYQVIEINSIEKVKANKNVLFTIKQLLLNRSFKLEKSYPYIYSLLFAENSYLPDINITSYRENGISHLFAISGTHISIFILILQKLLKKLKIKENRRYLIIIIFLMFYMFITDFSMSVARTSIFTILTIINTIYYFNIESKNLLFLTLAIVLFINPLNLLDIGLQYSFIISLTLILKKESINKKANYFSKLLYISYLSFIVSIPITIYHFYSLNLLSIFYNIFFVPYVSILVLPFIILSYLLPFLDNILFFIIEIMNKISLFLNNINILKLSFCKINMSIFVVYYASIFIYLKSLNRNKKGFVIFLILIIFLNNIWVLRKNNRLTFLDIGQGDSFLLTVNDTNTLIDTGGIVMENDSKYTYNLSKNKIIPYLKSLGIKKLNNLILTHGDIDHMKESIYLIKNFNIDNIYLNSNEFNFLEKEVISLAQSKSIKIHILKENEYINLKGIKLDSLNKARDNENDSSIVLYFIINNYKVLLTGDISKNIELELIKKYDLSNLTILKLAHHGSKNSSDYNFLKETNPMYSIISAGYDNKFNHPNSETINNLNKLDINYYDTINYGSITFNFNNGTFSYSLP